VAAADARLFARERLPIAREARVGDVFQRIFFNKRSARGHQEWAGSVEFPDVGSRPREKGNEFSIVRACWFWQNRSVRAVLFFL
jgi:hypothetical protein